MGLPIPTRKITTDQIRNYIRSDLPELDPSVERRSFIGALVKSLGSLMADWYIALKRYADNEPFPQTATGDFLLKGWWRAITKLSPNPAAPAHGYIAVTGVAGTTIVSGTLFGGSDSIVYASLASATIVGQSQICGLTYDSINNICIVETANPHFLGSGVLVTMSGADQSPYNGTFPIDVTDVNEFTYVPASAPGATPATGTPLLTATFAAIFVEATTTGQATNASSGTSVSLQTIPSGANSTATVGAGGLTGGTETETQDEYRARILEALGTDFGMFSGDEIEIVAKQVPGVTRVFVRKASLSPPPGYPQEGQVKIAFLRDDDANPLPSAQEVADVRNRILALELPAHTAPEDVIVMSPPPFAVNFAFSALSPDTPGMRRAIISALQQFFKEVASWGGAINTLDYECAIIAAYDFETRQKLRSFTLTSPTGDIVAGVTAGYDYDDFPVLGTVTFG